MGFTSIDNMVSELTDGGKSWSSDINKITTAATTYTAGRVYDLSPLVGTPDRFAYGEHLINSYAPTSLFNWTANGTGFAATGGVFAKTSGTGTTLTADSMGKAIVAGRFYRVQFTVSAWTSSNVFFSLGGVNGTNRAATGTFVEIITASNTNGFVLNASVTTGVWSVSNISVVEWGASSGDQPMFNPATTATTNALYHGGDVSTDTKHLLNIGMMTTAATGVGTFRVIDILGSYPYINANTNSTQTCYNTNTLPRYTDGAGVKAFVVSGGTGYVANATTVGASAHTFSMVYTNSAGTGSRQMPFAVNGTASAIMGHISHSGVAAGNTFPLPLAHGDNGVRSIQNVVFTASGTANTYYHVVLYRELARLPVPVVNVYYEREFLNQIPSLKRVYDGACIGLLYTAGGNTVASTTWLGHIDVGWG